MLRRESVGSTELNIESLPVPVEFADYRQDTVVDDQNAVYVTIFFFIMCTLNYNISCFQTDNNYYIITLTGSPKKTPVHIKLPNMMI